MTTRRFPHLPAESWDLLLADELPEPSVRRLEAHLDGCAECRAALEEAEPALLFRRLRDLEVREDVFEGLWEGVAAGIEPGGARPAATEPADTRRVRRAALLGFGAGAAAVVVALVLGWQAGLRSGPAPGGATTSTAGETGTSPCPESVAALALTREECAALFGSPIEGPVLRVEALDLRGL